MPMTISDFKYAARLLWKSPWFTLLTVLVLSGGVFISVYTFAALNTMIYGDLPLPDGGSVVRVSGGTFPNVEPLDAFELAEIRAETETLSELGVYRASRSVLADPVASRTIQTIEAHWGIFEFTRTPPLLGRGFERGDSSAGAEPVAVLSFQSWQSIFAGDRDVIGKLVSIDRRTTRIVGVMPQDYMFPIRAELWLPLGPRDLDPVGYTENTLESYARLRPGVSAEAAETELRALLQQVRAQRPAAENREPDTVSIYTFQQAEFGSLGAVVFGVLNLLAFCVLLLAAANVSNLLLARTNNRVKEIGVRVALGAPRVRLIVQMALESVMLCAVGGGVALFLAARALRATGGVMASIGSEPPIWWRWGLDREAATVAGLLLLLTVVLVSALPAITASRIGPSAVLSETSRRNGGRRTGRLSRSLVALQVTLVSTVMLVGGGISVVAQRAASFEFWGLDTEGVFTMFVEPAVERYGTAEARLSFYERLLDELRGTAGVDAAMIMQRLGPARFRVEGREYATPDERPVAWVIALSETPSRIGPTLREGRAFDSRDSATGLKTVIVDESLARALWPNESALDRRIEVSIGDSGVEQRLIVGVVDAVSYDPFNMTQIGNSAIYVPVPQVAVPTARFLIRDSSGSEDHARTALHEALGRVDPTIPPGDVASYTASMERESQAMRTVAKLLLGCGAFAILLAIAGIYGLSSNAVVLRVSEISLRRALGATNGKVIGLFLSQGIRQLAIGLGASALLSVAVLLVMKRGFNLSGWTLTLMAASIVAAVSATVLFSIYVSVRGVIRREPSTCPYQ